MAPGGAVEFKLVGNQSRTGVTSQDGSQSEGAISKHEPFNLQTATETNEPTRFVRTLSDGFALVRQSRVWGIHEPPIEAITGRVLISCENMR